MNVIHLQPRLKLPCIFPQHRTTDFRVGHHPAVEPAPGCFGGRCLRSHAVEIWDFSLGLGFRPGILTRVGDHTFQVGHGARFAPLTNVYIQIGAGSSGRCIPMNPQKAEIRGVSPTRSTLLIDEQRFTWRDYIQNTDVRSIHGLNSIQINTVGIGHPWSSTNNNYGSVHHLMLVHYAFGHSAQTHPSHRWLAWSSLAAGESP